MSKNTITIKKGLAKDEPYSIILLCAGAGFRIKSYGVRSLLKVKNQTIIDRQLSLFRKHLAAKEVIMVCGYQAPKLMNKTPQSLIKIENEKFERTNVVRSLGMGLRAMTTDAALVIYGDLVFNKETITKLTFRESFVLYEPTGEVKDSLGCTIHNNELKQIFYKLPNRWAQISFFINKELRILQSICWNNNNYNKFGFEAINDIISRGGKFAAHSPDKMKLIDIDNYKDLETASKLI